MAKKILYKIKAYHCPRCGGITEPTKKYCEYCERDLALRSENHGSKKVRLLIDCGNYVYFDSISNIEFTQTPQMIECTTLEDTTRHCVVGKYDQNFSVEMPLQQRAMELLNLQYSGIHRIRLEHLGLDMSYEQACYIANTTSEFSPNEIVRQRIEFIGVGESVQGKAIPNDILAEMRCPNCGAPVKSKYGACDYCAGWNEVEW